MDDQNTATLDAIMSRLTRRDFVRSVLVAGGAVAWAGYGRAPRSSAQGTTTLSQWYHEYGEAGTQDAALRYAQAYTTEADGNPAVSIEMVWNPGAYGTKLSAALLTADGPDIYENGGITVPVAAANQAVPLNDILTPDVLPDFSPLGLQVSQVGDNIYGIRMVVDTGVIYYRPSLLSAAGIAPPTTMDELIAATTALGSGRQKGLFIGNDQGVDALRFLIANSAGSQFLVDNQAAFNNERTVLAYQKLLELNQTGALLTGAPVDWYDPSSFTQGLVAMQWCGLWAMPQVQRELGDDFAVMAWPALDASGIPVTFFGGWSQFVNGNRPNVDLAKQFVNWLWIKRTDFQTDWNLAYGFHVPPRISVAASATQLQSGPAAQAVQILNANAQINPPEFTAAMDTAVIDALSSVLNGGADIATALATAEQAVNAEAARQATPVA